MYFWGSLCFGCRSSSDTCKLMSTPGPRVSLGRNSCQGVSSMMRLKTMSLAMHGENSINHFWEPVLLKDKSIGWPRIIIIAYRQLRQLIDNIQPVSVVPPQLCKRRIGCRLACGELALYQSFAPEIGVNAAHARTCSDIDVLQMEAVMHCLHSALANYSWQVFKSSGRLQ